MTPVLLKAVVLLLAFACCVTSHVINLATDPKAPEVHGVRQSGSLGVTQSEHAGLKHSEDSDVKQSVHSAGNQPVDSHKIKHMHSKRPDNKMNGKKYPKPVEKEGMLI